MDYDPSIKIAASVMRKICSAEWVGNYFVQTHDLPRCSGAASPEVIDNCCLDENVDHDWVTYRDMYCHGEITIVCDKCGRERNDP